MQVQQIVRASADVLTITRLSPGDTYKRVDDSAYGGTPVLRFGVVQDVMNNGSEAAVTALEYEADYSAGAKATLRVFTGSQPAAIYPATPDEVTAHLDDLVTATRDAVRRAQEDLDKKRDALAAVERMVAQVGSLTAPETTTQVLEAGTDG